MNINIVVEKADLNNSVFALIALAVTEKDLKGLTANKAKVSKSQLGLNELNRATAGALSKLIERHAFKAKPGQTLLLNFADNDKIQAVLLYGWKSEDGKSFDAVMRYRKFGSCAYETAKRLKLKKLHISAVNLELKSESLTLALCEGLELAAYNFTSYKKKEEDSYVGPECAALVFNQALPQKALELAKLYCQATYFARDLVNTPPNDCTPTFLMQAAKQASKAAGLKLDIFDRKALVKMGAGALLAVAAGSDEPPYLIKMSYIPKKKTKKVLSIVGKGVTFDSGGLSIKTGAGMETMKMDMAGAAAVIAVMKVVSRLKPDFEVRGYVPTTENMINGRATRPGDIIKAMSGKTVEILNTDAEGRLILADAICLAEKDGCDVIVDLATLTGACMVALGTEYAGLFANDDQLASKLLAAGDLAGEHFWRLPLVKEYKDWIKSPVADIKNLGKPFGGAITGALFIEEFVCKARWAHLDIAGPAFAEADNGHIKRGGVGFGVRTLLNYIRASR